MGFDLLEQVYRLNRAGESFAIATVVRVEKPISAKPGDKAIIKSDGSLEGWVGGGCAQDTVIREAKKVIREAQPRFLRLRGRGAVGRPQAPTGRPQGIAPTVTPGVEEGILEFPITCHSGGTLEIYVEPVLPRPQMILLGNSPVAVTLAKLVKVLNWQVDVVDPAATLEQFPDADSLSNDPEFTLPAIHPVAFILVATQGHDDEPALLAAARSNAPYAAFVASKKKFASRVDYMRARGLSDEQITRIKAPAGLDIGAVTPDEIAASILAEMIRLRRQRWMPEAVEASHAIAAAESIVAEEAADPVCGMTVEVASARYVTEYQGHKYYFCCVGCKEQFDANPVNSQQ
ncbi:MAG: XdhC family protein [Chloroflexi bacterium]|nr:XdhC family protein [Chloroflexota bacterium]